VTKQIKLRTKKELETKTRARNERTKKNENLIRHEITTTTIIIV